MRTMRPITLLIESPQITAKNAAQQEFIPLMRELVRAYQAFARYDERLIRKQGLTTAQFDVFNLTNSGVPTTVRLTSVNFNEVTAILSPRVLRIGVRYDF